MRWTIWPRRAGVSAPDWADRFFMTCQRANRLTIPPPLRLDVDNGPAAHLALQNLRGEFRQRGKRHGPGHPFEAVERQLAHQAAPRFDPFLARTHHRIDAEQIDR